MAQRRERNPAAGMGVRLTSHRHGYEHDMTHDEVYAALGLDPKRHLPNAGVPETPVQGVTVYVLATDDPRRERTWRSRRDGSTHSALRGKRTYAICTCGRHVEAGHLHQHVCRS